jgi:inositol phosphorylceramide mannosyltransferase catalytic subunit
MPVMSEDRKLADNIPNAWLASAPGHPLWMHLLTDIVKDTNLDARPEVLTGPIRIRDALLGYNATLYDPTGKHPIKYITPGLIFPFDWHLPGKHMKECSAQFDEFNETKCKAGLGVEASGAYAITYWSHSWDDDKSLKNLHH